MGKSTISMAIFNSYVILPEGMWDESESIHSFSYIPMGCFSMTGNNQQKWLVFSTINKGGINLVIM
jgi:hypothetical protein